MQNLNILIIGGGIGGLCAAIALRQKGHKVEIIEKDPEWSVYGVGIIQQANVVRAVHQLGILDNYLDAGFGFDFVEMYRPDGQMVARIPAPKLAEGYPANVGINRPALHKVLGDAAINAGASIRLGVTAKGIEETEAGVHVVFSDGTEGEYDLVVGADGVMSDTRRKLFPDYPDLVFAGQAVWRYNLPRPKDMDALRAFEGEIGVGLVPLSEAECYMYVTTPEPDSPRYPVEGIAAKMREKLKNACPWIKQMAEQITDDEGVVYRPLSWHFKEGDWHKGRVVLLGDAVHGTTPHLGQGAGMAIEDGLVLADELEKHHDLETAFQAYRDRRYDRCKFIVDASVSVCDFQMGRRGPIDYAQLTRDMFAETAQPI